MSVSFRVFIKSPVIIIPANIYDCKRPVLCLDTGSLSIESQLIQHDKTKDYKQESKAEKVYDNYIANLKGIRIIQFYNGLEKGIQSYNRDMGINCLKDFDVNVLIQNNHEPLHPLFPTVQVCLDLVKLNFQLTLQSIEHTASLLI